MDQDELFVPYDGGVEYFERLFGLSSSPSPYLEDAIDAIIVSVDLEASGGQRNTIKVNRKQVKNVREVGFAILDTRTLFNSSSNSRTTVSNESTSKTAIKHTPKHPLISTQQFSTFHASEDFEACDITEFRECLFAPTRYVAKEDLVATITRCLQFQEDLEHHGAGLMSVLRNIVIVGHTPQHDLEIIRRLGVQISRVAPVVAVLDTHRLSKCILGAGSSAAEKHTPLEHHALSDVLVELGVPHEGRSLHNAGNDATYTLHALILLAIRWAEATGDEEPASTRLQQLRVFVEAEMKAPKWKPVRRALGAHSVEEIPRSNRGLGSGLEALAKRLMLETPSQNHPSSRIKQRILES